MSTYYWERFILNGRSDEMLRIDEESDEVFDLNGDGDHAPNEERYRYRLPGKPEDGDWMFLQNVSGIWMWWDWTVEETGYHRMPEARTLEEAQAAAVAMWRTS